MVNADTPELKRSYTIPCAASFRDAVLALAKRRRANAADIARSMVLALPADVIDAYADPGGPAKDDRETIVLQSGAAKGRPWRRKPRLQVRLAPGYAIETIRKALAVALDLDAGKCAVSLGDPKRDPEQSSVPVAAATAVAVAEESAAAVAAREASEERGRLRAVISVLSFTPLRGGIRNRADALHVLGFAPDQKPDQHTVRARFRMMATIHHPDGEFGDHERMAQLNDAVALLRRGA